MSSLPASATAPRRGRWRWSVALLATVLMVVRLRAGGLRPERGRCQPGAGLRASGRAVYVEGRLDMPDGQEEALADFLTAFPGFTDAAASC